MTEILHTGDSALPVLVAHRGYPACYPENTIVGIKAAIDAGAQHVEFDVQMSADNQLMVIHDDSLLRTASTDQSVFDLNMEQLNAISVHEPERLGDQYANEFIPSLQQMLQCLAAYKSVTAWVEIKEESLLQFGLEPVMDALIIALKPYQQHCVIISFSADAISYAQQHSTLRTGWVLHHYDANYQQQASTLMPDFILCNQKKVVNEKQLWHGDWQWMLYGVETVELAQHWASKGVPFVETDHIGELIKQC